MKTIILSGGFLNPSDADRTKRYADFLQWIKEHHSNFYRQYSSHFSIPAPGFHIVARMDYIEPEHKSPLQQVLDEYNGLSGI